MNKGTVYTLWNYEAQSLDELSFREGDAVTILRRHDDSETEWWWARLEDNEGYVPRNLLGVTTVFISLPLVYPSLTSRIISVWLFFSYVLICLFRLMIEERK